MLGRSRGEGPRQPGRRRGATAAEMAICLPLLVTMLVGTIDFCRLFYAYSIITDCARNGAAYAADKNAAASSPYTVANRTTSIQNAALAGAVNLSPTPTVSPIVDGATSVQVTVNYQFHMITSYLGTSPITLSRMVQMSVAPYP